MTHGAQFRKEEMKKRKRLISRKLERQIEAERIKKAIQFLTLPESSQPVIWKSNTIDARDTRAEAHQDEDLFD